VIKDWNNLGDETVSVVTPFKIIHS